MKICWNFFFNFFQLFSNFFYLKKNLSKIFFQPYFFYFWKKNFQIYYFLIGKFQRYRRAAISRFLWNKCRAVVCRNCCARNGALWKRTKPPSPTTPAKSCKDWSTCTIRRLSTEISRATTSSSTLTGDFFLPLTFY